MLQNFILPGFDLRIVLNFVLQATIRLIPLHEDTSLALTDRVVNAHFVEYC